MVLVLILLVVDFVVVTESAAVILVLILLVVEFIVVSELVFLTTKQALYAFEIDVPYRESDSKCHKWQLQPR